MATPYSSRSSISFPPISGISTAPLYIQSQQDTLSFYEDEGDDDISSKFWFATQPLSLCIAKQLHQQPFSDVVFHVKTLKNNNPPAKNTNDNTSTTEEEQSIETTDYYGHKVILYARSVHFRQLFEAKVALKQQLQQVVITIEDRLSNNYKDE